MTFNDTHTNLEKRYSIGQETDSGKYYLSFPVSNHMVDYEEYYEITNELYSTFPKSAPMIEMLLERCRNHEHDNLLLQKPGKHRGLAT
jgi:hypothetical protein